MVGVFFWFGVPSSVPRDDPFSFPVPPVPAPVSSSVHLLREFHDRRLQVTFSADDRSQEQEIDMTTRTATDYIKVSARLHTRWTASCVD